MHWSVLGRVAKKEPKTVGQLDLLLSKAAETVSGEGKAVVAPH